VRRSNTLALEKVSAGGYADGMNWIRRRKRLIFIALCLLIANAAIALFVWRQLGSDSNITIRQWFTEPQTRPDLVTLRDAPCPGAPFLLPSQGFIGLLWGDTARPYNLLRRHTGIDIFGDGEPGEVPVVAAHHGYLTRLDDWLSTVIIRHDDPLQPGRTIWTYYTHMASRDGRISYVADEFPRGTSELFVEQGTVLGYQGEYNGSGPAIGLHVHMSIVESGEDGNFLNEAVLGNTLDPSLYFGLPLNIAQRPQRPIRCAPEGGS
jgi:murein DD-endopeptidase MepM/ murein hydrolase activator NlpD